ncbi:MAG: hypothetical protein WC765_09785, partial [Phycisphaerae bacterium]
APTGVSGAGEYWYHTTYLFEVRPNPIVEYVTIGSAVWVDELVIDTLCMPEPATVGLLCDGALGMLRKRK